MRVGARRGRDHRLHARQIVGRRRRRRAVPRAGAGARARSQTRRPSAAVVARSARGALLVNSNCHQSWCEYSRWRCESRMQPERAQHDERDGDAPAGRERLVEQRGAPVEVRAARQQRRAASTTGRSPPRSRGPSGARTRCRPRAARPCRGRRRRAGSAARAPARAARRRSSCRRSARPRAAAAAGRAAASASRRVDRRRGARREQHDAAEKGRRSRAPAARSRARCVRKSPPTRADDGAAQQLVHAEQRAGRDQRQQVVDDAIGDAAIRAPPSREGAEQAQQDRRSRRRRGRRADGSRARPSARAETRARKPAKPRSATAGSST